MSILIDENTRLVVQGITGRDGSFHAGQMIEYGTNVVAGVTPGKGGQKFQEKVPVFASMLMPAAIEVASSVNVRFSAGRSASVAVAVKDNSLSSITL